MTLHNYKKTNKSLSQALLIFVSLLISLNTIFAQEGGVASGENLQTNPKTRNTTISATVPDIINPSAPLLISPDNNSLINSGVPTFIWQESSDNVGIDHYQMYLDGELFLNNIPIVSTLASLYNSNYDSSSGKYSLTPNSVINDGTHTWEIVALDAANNKNSSATWTFNIDTLAPQFNITSINSNNVNISAQDINSVPENPIELEDNPPVFSGTGEINSGVKVTISIPNQDDQIINFNIDSDGNWNFQTEILPRDRVITLNFVITDQASNISVLTKLKILIVQQYITIPPTFPNVTPTESNNTPTLAIKPIKIPINPPKEIVRNLLSEIKQIIPHKITNIASKIPKTILKSTNILAPIGTIIIILIVLLLSFLVILLQLNKHFSWQLIIQILQILKLLPHKNPQGIVYNSLTGKPVAFALLTIINISDDNDNKVVARAITDTNGIYQGIQLPVGKYVIKVDHRNNKFPTKEQKPQQLFLIPMDKAVKTQEKYLFKNKLRKIFEQIRFNHLFWLLFIVSIIITIFYPTTINIFVLILYGMIFIKKTVGLFNKPSLSGYILNPSGSPIENAIVRISKYKQSNLESLLLSNSEGYFQVSLKPNKYQVQVTRNRFVWIKEGSKSDFKEIDINNQAMSINIVLKNIADIYSEIFK